MPQIFHHLQELDEKRIKNIKNFMTQSADVERQVFPIIDKCLDGIVNAANQINEKEVSTVSLTANLTGVSDIFKQIAVCLIPYVSSISLQF